MSQPDKMKTGSFWMDELVALNIIVRVDNEVEFSKSFKKVVDKTIKHQPWLNNSTELVSEALKSYLKSINYDLSLTHLEVFSRVLARLVRLTRGISCA